MDKIRRGKCLIITGSERNLEEGYNADRKNLDGLFKGLHFEACYPSKIEISKWMKFWLIDLFS